MRSAPIRRRGSVYSAPHRLPSVPLLAALVFAATLAACGVFDPEIGDVGTIVFQDIEAGCWLIDTETEDYFPVNLPGNLQVPGIQVQFEAVARLDLTTFCPGRIIEITWISEIED